ncbi:hypothetical protein, partial [Burkholderia pseudomallei]|uniref:hypothetical protein n=1 Tax=Burkholderia pseudomallei TaxID=28450 RepID=UPI003F6870EF
MPPAGGINVTDNGVTRALDLNALRALIVSACERLRAAVSPEPNVAETVKNMYDRVRKLQAYHSPIRDATPPTYQDSPTSQVTADMLR